MAVVKETSSLFRDQLAGGMVPDYLEASGRTYTATGTVTNAADDSSGSTFRLCDVPSDAILDEDTFFKVDGWGFASIRIGTLETVDALVSAARSAAVNQRPVGLGDANHGKRLWELLGLAEDPGGKIALYAHAVANATGAGDMPFRVRWIHN